MHVTPDPAGIAYRRAGMHSTDLKPLRIATLVTAYLAAWLAARPYEGITHDAQAYVLQALARLHPESVGGDLFLRFGSQNDFTLFPWLVAGLIRFVGVEPAALIVTTLSSVALLVAGWILARSLTGSQLAWFAVGLLIAIPGWYGAGGVFRYDEMSLNARVPCEVICIIALAAAGGGRMALASALLVVAAMLHPLMALPACGIVAMLWIAGTDRPAALRNLTIAAVAGIVVVGIALWIFAPAADPSRTNWLATLHSRNAFLFFGNWTAEDWLQNALGFSSLALTASAHESLAARRLAFATMFLGALGLLIAWLATASQRFDLLLLGQTWRWTWLTRFIAIVLLPATIASLWRRQRMGRSVALLTATGWASHAYFGGVWLLAATGLWFARDRLPTTAWRTIAATNWCIAGLAVGWGAFLALQAWPLALDTHLGPRWAQRIVNVAGVAGPLVLIVTGCGLVALMAQSRAAILAVLATASFALVGASLFNWARVAEPRYSQARHEAFAAWRTTISPKAEVLWHQDPAACWVLLERASYLSGSQTAGLLYSRKGIAEFDRRRQVLAPLANPGWWTLAARDPADEPRPLTLPILEAICQDPALGYVVDESALGPQIASAEWPTRGQTIYLYECSRYRKGRVD